MTATTRDCFKFNNQSPTHVLCTTLAIALFLSQYKLTARLWNDVPSYQQVRFEDTNGKRYLQMKEKQYELAAFTGVDNTNNNNIAPSFAPTSTRPPSGPRLMPISTNLTSTPSNNAPASMKPTSIPSSKPTSLPLLKPTFIPISSPTSLPTTAPTVYVDPFAPAVIPSNPDPYYFNYDNSTFSQYGPGQLGLIEEKGIFHVGIQNNQWGKAKSLPNSYWQELTNDGWGPWRGSFDNSVFMNNVCVQGQNQSPIDLRPDTACTASHQVRPLRGNFKLRTSSVTKKILNNKLRLEYRRRPCADWNNPKCKEPDPPHADFPNGFSGFSDVLHIDVKVPSEHMIEGVRYDAEMQIFHFHPGRKRFPVQSVLIRAINDDDIPGVNITSYNYYFQALLNEFQFVYNMNAFRCGIIRKNNGRRLTSLLNRTLTNLVKERKLETNAVPAIWNPYHPMLVPTIWFYRYDGSLTEPPCSEVVSWFVADKPMVISTLQLEQLKLILFTNVDLDCRKTSVQNLQSVARPVRQSKDRPVARCTASNFGPDVVV